MRLVCFAQIGARPRKSFFENQDNKTNITPLTLIRVRRKKSPPVGFLPTGGDFIL